MVLVLAVVSVFMLVIRPGGDGNSQATAVSTNSSTQQSIADGTETTQPALLATSEPASSPEPEATIGRDDSTEFDLVELRRQLLQLINADRVASGMQPLEIDAVAEAAAQDHADEMAALGYLSHWNVDGFGPDWRYSRSGGRDAVQESIAGYSLPGQAGSADAPVDWTRVIVDIHQALSNDEHYEQNMLAPYHTHVGLGLFVNQVTGRVRVAQEFVNRFVCIDQTPTQALCGERIIAKGRS